MKEIILLALLCTFSLQQTVLLSSSASNTIVTSPANFVVVHEAYHNANNPNYIGYGARWIYKNGSSSWPNGDQASFLSNFYADCQANATLVITADNVFSASLNGGAVFTGNWWPTVYKFTLTNLRCGLNTLTVNVTNRDEKSPAALIFAVVQNQSKCYDCLTPTAFYNRNTCKCQCLDRCNCATASPRYIWAGYPICGCRCRQVLRCATNRYFNPQTCTCLCKPISCLPGYYQDQNTCLCRKRTAWTPWLLLTKLLSLTINITFLKGFNFILLNKIQIIIFFKRKPWSLV